MKTEFIKGEETVICELERDQNRFIAKVLREKLEGEIVSWDPPHFSIKISSGVVKGSFFSGKDFVDIHLPQGNFRPRFAIRAGAGRSVSHHVPGSLSSPMPGKIIKVLVKEGDQVEAGDLLMVLEAMKMEHKIVSPQDGVVEKVFFKEGERVGQEVELVRVMT